MKRVCSAFASLYNTRYHDFERVLTSLIYRDCASLVTAYVNIPRKCENRDQCLRIEVKGAGATIHLRRNEKHYPRHSMSWKTLSVWFRGDTFSTFSIPLSFDQHSLNMEGSKEYEVFQRYNLYLQENVLDSIHFTLF